MGTFYRGAEASVYINQNVSVGDNVALYPEPSNPHDPNAIKVEHNGTLLGYVPRARTDVSPYSTGTVTAIMRSSDPQSEASMVFVTPREVEKLV